MPVEWPKVRAKARGLIVKHWLVLCFFFATLIALTWPQPGRATASVVILGDIHLVQTINIFIVFLISGLVLKTDDIKKAARHWLGGLYGFVAILLITPCLGFALRELPLTPPEFAVGLTIFAAVPTTLGVGEALVRASGGNAALALLLLVGTNMLGIATMPPIIKLLLSTVEDGLSVSVDAANLLAKLTVTVLVPAVIGKALRELFAAVRAFATKWKVQLGMFSTVQLALIIWQTLSGAQDVLVHQRFLDIFIVIVCAGIMHALYLVFNFVVVCFVLRMPLREAIAVSIMASQKSAPVAVTVISYLTSDVTKQGLLAVPCISGQLLQIFMGAGLAPLLARRVKRQAALAAEKEGAATTAATASDGAATAEGDDKAAGAGAAAARDEAAAAAAGAAERGASDKLQGLGGGSNASSNSAISAESGNSKLDGSRSAQIQ